jgi:hypothetical protein
VSGLSHREIDWTKIFTANLKKIEFFLRRKCEVRREQSAHWETPTGKTAFMPTHTDRASGGGGAATAAAIGGQRGRVAIIGPAIGGGRRSSRPPLAVVIGGRRAAAGGGHRRRESLRPKSHRARAALGAIAIRPQVK